MLSNIKVLGLLIFATVGAHAQTRYSLDELRQKSVDYSHQIKEQDYYIQAAQEQIKMAERQRYATIDGQVTYLYNDKIVTNDAPHPDALHYYNIGMPITQPLYTGGAIKNNILLAESKAIISDYQKTLTTNEIIFKCDISYWSVVARKEILKSWKGYEVYMKHFVEEIEKRVGLELSMNSELLRAKVQYNTVLNELIKAEKELNIAKMNLNFLIGEELTSDFELADETLEINYTLPNAAESIEMATTKRPEILIAQENVLSSEYKSQISKSQYRPQVGIIASPSFNNGLLNNAEGVALTAMGQVSVPIVQWGNKRSERSIQEAYLGVSQAELAFTKESIELEIMQTIEKLDADIQLVKLAEETMQESQENLNTVDTRYSEQLVPLIEVTDAQSLLQQSYLKFVANKMAFFYNTSVYYKAIGVY